MPTKHRVLTDADYVAIGRRHSSRRVSLDAHEAEVRWKADLAVLALFGFGPKLLARFVASIVEHDAARLARPAAIQAKDDALDARESAVEAAWGWVDQVAAALGVLAADHGELANGLNACVPTDTAELPTGMRGMVRLLTAHSDELEEEFRAQARLDEAEPLAQAVAVATAVAPGAVAAPAIEGRELDLLDGKLVSFMVRLNKAGRKAFRKDDRRRAQYRLHHVGQYQHKAPAPSEGPSPT